MPASKGKTTKKTVPQPAEQAAQVQEPTLTIPQSMWVKICRAGLKQRFYDTDAISRAFMGDDLSDILNLVKEPKAEKPAVKKG